MLKCFLTGALGYPLLEFLYRGRTHYSMAIAGGISCLLIKQARKLPMSVVRKSLLCGCEITLVEYLCGRLWNNKYQVWDYRNVPLNYQGQISLPYSLLWCILAGGFICLQDSFDK